ncbi:substrate-binding periplasmic protein [Dactylococcopsis salina]|uniref:Periplasmic component of amino acid ABC-type transporter/signal transduction system n=1 Tax=Dactylococcopsis salina (strain PCC 8305) TaxID=13035 RepID=K9YZY3_DACS8|nr:ABC transporter substrate-binding protein [Dactylococcopsis salina]AFZ52042.1 periplasmic component of amino acid ABC-type transporter/signal transduction system [Dactylococcopsis salina PCC 8305]
MNLLQSGQLTIAASDFDARPMSYIENGTRSGYEPELMAELCHRLDLKPVWLNLRMEDFYEAVVQKKCDLLGFNQAITPERSQKVKFTRCYGYFDEAVLVRAGSNIHSPADLVGKRVGGLAASTNLALAESWEGVETVAFPGSDRVLPEMIEALRNQEIDGVVDDELVLVPPAKTDPTLEVGFSVPTQVPFAIAIHPDNTELWQTVDETLQQLINDGFLKQLWQKWIPWKPAPF